MNQKSIYKLFIHAIILLVLLYSNEAKAQKLFKGSKTTEVAKLNLTEVSTYELYELELDQINKHVRSKSIDIHFKLQFDEILLELKLYAHKIKSDDIVSYIQTENGIEIAAPRNEVLFKPYAEQVEAKNMIFAIDENLFAGSFDYEGKHYIIEPYWWHVPDMPKTIVMIYESSIINYLEENKCGTDEDFIMKDSKPMKFGFKPEMEELHLRSVNPCREVEYGSALDWAFVNKYGGNNGAWNRVDFVMGLVETQYTGEFNWDFVYTRNAEFASGCSTCNPWTSSNDAGVVLSSFRTWGNNGGFQGQTYDVAGLWTNRDFDGGTVGIAYIGGMCNSSKYHALQDYSNASWAMRVMVSHELGHNFAAGHDATTGFIMSPSVNNTTEWSQNSKNVINNFVNGNGGNCLGDCPESCESFIAEADVVHTSCDHQNGRITVTPSGGTSPYIVDIGNGFTNQTQFTGLAPGVYTITVMDANDCEFILSVEIFPSVSLNFVLSSVHTSCGEENGLIEINVIQGNAPYEYNIGFGPTNQNLFYNLPGGTYDILVTDSQGCTSTDIVVIDPSVQLLADLVIRHTSCGNNNGRVIVNAQGGTTPYSYTYNGVYRQLNVFDSLPAGNYSFEVVDFYGCIFTVPGTINGSMGVLATSSSIPASCGGSNGSITVTVTQGVTPYIYSLNGNSQSSNVFSGLPSGAYTVIVTDSTGCTRAVQATVGTSGALSLSSEIEHAYCEMDQGRIEVIPLNGSTPFEYDFGGGFQAENYNEQLSAGTYTVDVRDSLGCLGSINVVIVTSPAVEMSAVSTPSSCVVNNGTVLITGTGGSIPYTYLLGSQESDLPLFEDLSAGMYIAGVRDSLGCEAMVIIVVESATGMTVDIDTEDANCGESGGQAIATASGGTAPYSYDIGEGAQMDGVFSDLEPGIYDLVAIDATGCTYYTFFEIEGYGAITLELIETDPTTCGLSNGKASFEVNGGNGQYRYYLDGVEVPGVELADLSGGNHSFRVVDSGDCESEMMFSIGTSTSMSVNIIATFTTCENENGAIEANVSNGSQPYRYDIGQGGQSSNKFENLESGTYELVIRDDEGCEIHREIILGNEGLKPRANFSSILNAEEVIFVNTSMGNPQSSEWDFGDGNSSSENNPRHRYEQLGSYTVCLTVVNPCGENTKCTNLNVNGDRDCIANDSLALVSLYESTDGVNWNQSWDLQTPINTWYGLTFDPSGCLTRIDLENNNLNGALPVEIGNFLTLEYMNLSHNSIVSVLPKEIGNLLTLETLNLSHNEIIGEIPEEIEGVRRMIELNLSNNQMSGAIDPSIYKLGDLGFLNLSHNRFTGSLTSDLGLLVNLSTLDVSFNELEGQIPDVWAQLSEINNIYLNDNKFIGSFPTSINQIDSLTAFWISSNRFTMIPDMSQHDKWEDIPSKGFRIDNNQLTFKDIIPNLEIIDELVNRIYSPQDKVYIDTLLQLTSGSEVLLDIGVDSGVSNVEYQWFRNGSYLNSNNVPILEIQQAQVTDAGIYHCELVNPQAPELRLISRNIILEISTSTNGWTDSEQIKMYPNPVKGGAELYLEISKEWKEDAVISIIGMDGKLVSSQNIKASLNQTRLSIMSPYNPGVYIIKINSGNRVVTINRVVVF